MLPVFLDCPLLIAPSVFSNIYSIYIYYYICRTHMQDLQEVTQEVHYENFRADKLASGSGGASMKKIRWVVYKNYFLFMCFFNEMKLTS